MSYQPGEQPFTQPQDPWSGTQGVASAPTDPLPQPVRGQFTPGVAAPSVWSQETVAHGDPYVPDDRGGGRAGLYVLVVLLIVVLGGAGGYGAWWAITNYPIGSANPQGSNTTTITTGPTSQSPSTSPTEVRFSPELVEVGTCLQNRGSQVDPEMYVVPCDSEGDIFQVLLVESGEDIPEDGNGDFTEEDTADTVCASVPSNRWFGWNSSNNAQDYFYCMTDNVTAN